MQFCWHCNVLWIEVEKEVQDKNEEFLKSSLVVCGCLINPQTLAS